MRKVGYDAITLGNHEFDFKGHRMAELLPQIKAPIICANFFKAGAERPFYPTYTIKTYGQKRIGYVGVCTPSSMRDEYYAFFDKDGNKLYDLRPNDVVELIQQSVDSVRRAGADYVVLLSHLGEMDLGKAINSHTLINNIKGRDAVLDGHTHSVIPHDMVPDLNNKDVPVTQTGTQFAYIGKLVITKDGNISTSLIPTDNITYANQQVTAATDSIKQLMETATNVVIGSSDFELTINDSQGRILVRKGETNLGNLCADALRECFHADIGLINGGGIRNTIPAGKITLGDAINTIPFYDLMCKIEVTGEAILNMLKKCTERYPQEDGSFPQVAGMRFTLNASNHTITDVQIMNRETSQYEPLQPDRKYTIGVSDYYNSGGFYGMLKGATLLEQTDMIAYTALANYIKDALDGDVSAYSNAQGRINIIKN
jgi:2',3'-cyclic-nucleotide 2'-phosphodiesterase (5'-nucleotidase family)